MVVPDPQLLDVASLDEAMNALPNSDAVFLVWAGDRSAYLAKTSMLRRRLLRIFKPAGGAAPVAQSARSGYARGILAHGLAL